ncbi:MAG TPA: sensor domain-containing diguanylate cyclase [Gaiellaceae bacterium]|nr:sensor domain-containing diguanylate cyclase [Gaiellaceae bacterium]
MAPANRLQALLDLSHRLSSTLDLDEVLREFSERAAELTGATAAEISSWERDDDALVMLVEYIQGRDEITVGGGAVYPLAEYPLTRRVLETQAAAQVRVSDPAADPAERELLTRRGQGSLLMLPLVARGETIGLMEIIDERDRIFDDFDVEFCRALCDVVATALRNARLYAQVEELAARDRLTGLYNRRLFEEHLGVAVARARRTGEELSLLVIDLDGLKRINDLGGHTAGDEALQALAEALTSTTRATDVTCRLGGDEFAVILPGSTPTDALTVAERAQRRLAELGKGQCSFSGGVARSLESHSTPYDLYRSADIAAYRAKSAGGARTLLGVESQVTA